MNCIFLSKCIYVLINSIYKIWSIFFIETREVPRNELRPGIFDRDGSLRYIIFKDLWEKGYYLTSGMKFGADFLVYPGVHFLINN